MTMYIYTQMYVKLTLVTMEEHVCTLHGGSTIQHVHVHQNSMDHLAPMTSILFLKNQSLGKRKEQSPGFFPTQFVQPTTAQ